MKVLIADDHPIVRSSLKHVLDRLDTHMEYLEAGNFDQALAIMSDQAGIELVLLDLMMPGREPIDGLREIVEALPDVPVVVVSAIESRRDALRAIDVGAMGYIPKTVSHDEFLKMLRVVLEGGLCLPRSLSDKAPPAAPSVSVAARRLATDERLAGLTRRQRQVLALLAEGKSNIEIARDLGVSDKTVRFYISAILKTLGVRNRTQAALVAARIMENGSRVSP